MSKSSFDRILAPGLKPPFMLAVAVVAGAIFVRGPLDQAPSTTVAPPARTAVPALTPEATPRTTPGPMGSLSPLPAMTTGQLAYSVDGNIYIAATDGSDPLLVADATDDDHGYYHPAWSPDGRFLAFSGQRETFRVVDAEGRSITAGEGCCIAWAPDSSRIAGVVGFAGGNPKPDAFTPKVEVIITTIAGSGVARLGLPNSSASLGNLVQVHWTPDGRSVVLSRVSGAPGGGSTWLVPVDGDEPSAFPVEPVYAAGSMFSPDGSKVVGMAGARLVLAAANGSGIRLLIAGHESDPGRGASPTWSPDGALIAIAAGEGFAVVDVATGSVRQIWSTPPSADPNISYAGYVLGWSADGERVLVEHYEPSSNGLWSIGLDGSDPQRLAEGEIVGASWQWLPAP